MKETFVADVTAFMEAAGQSTEWFNTRQTALYIGLQMEELAEKLSEVFWPGDSIVKSIVAEANAFKNGLHDDKVYRADREALLDADIDLLWVTVGAAKSAGTDVLGAMQEVARSNMSKTVDGKMIKDENGKVKKPDTYSPPALSPFVSKTESL